MGHEGHDHSHTHGPSHGSASASVQEHKRHAPALVATYVVTCSDSRGMTEDETGAWIAEALQQAGHALAGRAVIRDEPDAIRQALEAALAVGARAVIFNGGTGIGQRDVTVETLRPLFEKELSGFGELLRALSFQQIGSAAMLSRATAGVYRGLAIFALPGSPHAARLAMEALILPELGHVVREITRGPSAGSPLP